MDAVAGFVLAGGRSSRMGRDKALLPWGGGTLLDHVSGAMRDAVGSATVVGRDLPDLLPDRGPLGALWTALAASRAEWVLIAACDMPNLTPEFLRALAGAAVGSTADGVVCETPRGLHPLCAAYHRRLRPDVEATVRRNALKMHDFLSTIRVQRWPVEDPGMLANINTPQELEAWEAR